ncbi:MAG: glycosyltransferase [Treponema sp.]|nr:glycosyltransferase [Treponema sp.]
MKIAMFTDSYWPRVNGVTVSVDSFSRALIKEGHDVLIVCSSYPEDGNIPISFYENPSKANEPLVVKVPSLPVFISKEDRLAKFSKMNWVFKQVDSFNPDIIHINTEMMIGEFGIWYARTHNLAIVYTFHTMWEDYGPNYFPFLPVFVVKFFIRGILKSVLRRAYRVIVPTPQIKQAIMRYRLKIIPFMLPTGIEPDLFRNSKSDIAAFRAKLEGLFPILKNKRIVLFAGRIGKEKNLGFLLNILPEIISKHPDVILLIAGNGPDLEYYKEEAARLGIENTCVFTGYFDRKDLALVYSVSELFLFPSLTDTQGLVTLEAMLSGTPVVAIGALGTLTVMGGDNGGFMVKNNAAEFTGRVLELLEDKELYARKSEEAKNHAKAWSIEELTKKLIGLYKETISDYTEEFGYRITPVWELLIEKRWWKMNNMILKKKTKENWQKLLANLKAPESKNALQELP